MLELLVRKGSRSWWSLHWLDHGNYICLNYQMSRLDQTRLWVITQFWSLWQSPCSALHITLELVAVGNENESCDSWAAFTLQHFGSLANLPRSESANVTRIWDAILWMTPNCGAGLLQLLCDHSRCNLHRRKHVSQKLRRYFKATCFLQCDLRCSNESCNMSFTPALSNFRPIHVCCVFFWPLYNALHVPWTHLLVNHFLTGHLNPPSCSDQFSALTLLNDNCTVM